MLPPLSRLLRRTVLLSALGLGLMLALAAAAGWMLWNARLSARAQAQQAAANLALSLERDIGRNIEVYDLSLRAAREGVVLPELNTSSASVRHSILFDGAATARYFGRIIISDAEGRAIYDSDSAQPPDISIADRPYFAAHRNQPDADLLISLVDRGRLSKVPALILSRRVNGPDGAFMGIVAGSIQLGYFENLFDRLQLGERGSVAVFTRDGRLIARRPADPHDFGRDMHQAELFQRVIAAGAGSYEATAVLDGVRRLYSYRAIDNLPLVVSVGTAVDGIYADWRQEAWTTGSVLCAFAVLTALMALALRRELRRRSRAEQVARGSEAKLRTYFDHLADGVLVIRVGASERLFYEGANQAAEAMFGWQPRWVLLRTPAETWPAARAGTVEARLRECLAAGHPIGYEEALDLPAGRRTLRVTLAPVRDAAGRICLLLESLRDVTEHVRVQEQLLRTQRMEAVGQLTAGVAHDFNNMLQVQTSSLELAQHALQSGRDDTALACTATALRAAERGAQLVSHLLAFSCQQVLCPQPVPLDEVLARTTRLLGRTLDPSIALQLVIQPGAEAVFADPGQLEAALLGLALNARDAMPLGGRLRIGAAGRSVTALDKALDLPSGRYCVISVADDGEGMTPETLERACEPFFTTKGVGGSGLGLSMAQGFARQSKGALRIESAPGCGTRVELWLLPCRAPAREAAPAPVPGRRPARVLVVDDAPDVLVAVAAYLESAEFEAVTAGSAEQALAILAAGQEFDAMVTDYAMPGMSGAALILEAQAQHPELPAILMTGYDNAEVGHQVPNVRRLHKPVPGARLVEEVRAAMARHGAPALEKAD